MSGWVARLVVVGFGRDFAEGLIGNLLAATFRVRMRGHSLDDAHEARHLAAALAAGNSDPCDGGRDCHLDRATVSALGNATWPDSEPMREFLEIRP